MRLFNFANIKSALIALLMLVLNIGKGQNLVVNPSFEDTISLPTNYSQLERCSGCYDISAGTPDYFHTLGSYPVSVPNTFAGFQNARTGNGMTGIIVYWTGGQYREYIGVTLKSQLSTKKKYCYSMFLKLADSSGFVEKDIGVYFTDDTTFSSNWDNLPYTPQINNTKGMLLSLPTWTNISTTYTPSKAEKYIIIGNFLSDANSTFMQIKPFSSGNNLSTQAYYFFDDIWLSELKLPANAGNDTTICYEDNVAVTLGGAAEYGIVYKWEKMQNGSNETIANKAQISVLPKETTTYILTATDTTLPAECDCPKITSDTITVKVSVINECDTIKPPPLPPPVDSIIKIPNVFTPNGDGINDLFVIENIKPNTRVEIYNRWGTLVYENGDYRNDWGGGVAGQARNDEGVSDGVYFVVVVEPNEKARRGVVQIIR